MSDLVFSVAIITYNQEKYISETLDSILQQEHNFPYEIVIGDDCSSDGTAQIIAEYASKYPNIIKPLYNNPNKGIIKNYFNVIENCSGKYIMECAGDDYWLPGKVSEQISFMEENSEIGLCYGYAKSWNETTSSYSTELFGDPCKTKFENLIKGNNIPAPTVCFRNELIKKYISQINPIEKSWKMEDFPEWLWFSKESKISFFDKPLAVYRVIQDSASHSINYEKKIDFIKNTYDIIQYFMEKYDCVDEDLNNKKNLVIATYYLKGKKIKEANEYLREVKNIKSYSVKIKFLLLRLPVIRVIFANRLIKE